MKKHLIIILLLVLQTLSFIPVVSSTEYILDGDTVYIDDEFVYLSATPHTIIQDTDVIFELISKQYTGSIDVAFGVDSNLMKPKNPMLWNGSNWNVLNKEINRYDIEFQGMDRWWTLEDVNVNEDQLYRLKLTLDVEFNSSGKYFLAVKPHDEPIGGPHTYYIDPWWQGGWQRNYVVIINKDNISSWLNDFPVYVPINTTVSNLCQANGEDLRFVGSDNTTEYSYEIVNWSTTHTSEVYVKVPSISPSADTKFNVYYNNPGASDNQDKVDVWSNGYLAVYHFNENTSLVDSLDTYNGTRVLSGYCDIVPGKTGYALNISTNTYFDLGWVFNFSDDNFSLETWFLKNRDSASHRDFIRNFATQGFTFGVVKEDGVTRSGVRFKGVTTGAGGVVYTQRDYSFTNNTWHFANVTFDRTKSIANCTVDGGFEYASHLTMNGELNGTEPTRVGYANYFGHLDEMRISNVFRNFSWYDAQHSNVNATSYFLSQTGTVLSSSANQLWVNATQYINLTNASLNAWINKDGGYDGNYNFGFWVGTSFPVTHGNALQNVTDGTTVATSDEFKLQVESLSTGTVYYVKSWIRNATAFVNSTNNETFTTGDYPDVPTSVSSTVSGSDLSVTWTKGVYGADRTVIVSKNSDYPNNPQDGTTKYNNTGSSTTIAVADGEYLRMWSYNSTWGVFSISSVDVPFGGIYINVYDEDTEANLTFDVFVSNQSGSETYQSLHCNNTHIIDISECPQGEDVVIQISANESYANVTEYFTGYDDSPPNGDNTTITYVILQYNPTNKNSCNVTCWNGNSAVESYPPFTLDGDIITIGADDASNFTQINVTYTRENYAPRTYTMDVYANGIYTIECYLPPYDLKQLYLLQVIDENDDSIKDASIRVMRYINGAWQNISVLLTNGNGYANIYLIPNTLYKFAISADGYETDYADWTPSVAEAGLVPSHQFQLEFSQPTFPPGIDCLDYITFEGFINFTTNTLCLNYSDTTGETTSTSIRIYRISYTTNDETLLATYTRTGSTWNVYQAITQTDAYRATITITHTICDLDFPITLIFERNQTTLTTPKEINTLFTINYGFNPFGWSNMFMYFALLGCFFAFGRRGSGISLLLCGGLLLFLNSIIGFNTALSAVAGGIIPGLFIIVGIMALWRDHNKEVSS